MCLCEHVPVGLRGGSRLGTQVNLDASASTAAGTGGLTYLWTEDADNPETGLLSAADEMAPTWTPSVVGIYRFILVVADGLEESTPDSVSVAISHGEQGPDLGRPRCR